MTQLALRPLACLLALLFVTSGPVLGQRVSWFDINPSRSNNDDSDPNHSSGGRVNHVGATADFSRVYAATEWGGLYQSFDQGNTWVRIHTFVPSATWDVKVDPSNSRRVYATSFFDGRTNPQSGISISDDAGISWRPVNIPGLNTLNCAQNRANLEPAAWQIAIHPTNNDTVFVGTSCGLARTFNAGVDWDFVDPTPGDSAEQIYSVVAQGPETVDVIGDNGHSRSTTSGDLGSWVPITGPPGPVAGNSGPGSTIAASPAESYVLLAASQNDIFESVNGGTSWPTSLTLPTRGGQSNRQGRIPFVKTNQLSSSNQFDVWFGDQNLFKTTAITPSTTSPGGAARTPTNSWTNVQNNGHWDVGDVMFDPRFSAGSCPSLFTNDGGVYRNQRRNNPSCQGPDWEQPVITPHATWIFGFDGTAVGSTEHAISYGLQDNGGFASDEVREGYNPPNADWNNYSCCDVLHNSQFSQGFVDLQGAKSSGRAFRLYQRNRGGGGSNEINDYPSSANFTRFESGNQNVPFSDTGFVVNLSGVYFANDITGGISWTSLNAPTTPNSGSGHVKIATLGGRPNVYYHTGNGNPESQGLIFRSSLVAPTGAPGSNWSQLPLPAGIGAVTAFDIDPTNGNRAVISGINSATQNFEIWSTPDFGGNWNRLANLENLMLGITGTGGPQTFLNRATQGKLTATFNFGTHWQPSMFKYNPRDNTTILAGAIDAGVFLSLDDGSNWSRITNPTDPNSNSPHIPRPLHAYFSPGRFRASTSSFDVWVGSRGAGVWKAVIETDG